MNTKELLKKVGFRKCEQENMWVNNRVYVYCDDNTSVEEVVNDIISEYEDELKYCGNYD